MLDTPRIPPPSSDFDRAGAERVFQEFCMIYQPSLAKVEIYLVSVMAQAGDNYSEAYLPWYRCVHELLDGAADISEHTPPKQPGKFLEAIQTFCFESTTGFMRDVCISCGIPIQPGWARRFRENMETLQKAFSVLSRPMLVK